MRLDLRLGLDLEMQDASIDDMYLIERPGAISHSHPVWPSVTKIKEQKQNENEIVFSNKQIENYVNFRNKK